MAVPRTAPPTQGGTQVPITPAETQPAPRPVPAETVPEVPVTTQPKAGTADEPLERRTPGANGDDGGLWAGFPEKTPNGNAYGWWKNRQPGQQQGELPRFDLPILTPTSQRTVLDPLEQPQNDRNTEDRDRYRQDQSYNASRNNLRRGVIRDYLQQNLQNTIMGSRVDVNDRNGLQQLTRTVADTLARTLNDPLMLTNRVLQTIEREITGLLRTDINYTGINRSGTIPYDRAIQISDLLLRTIPGDLAKQFKDVTPQKMLDGLILLQLWAGPGGCLDDVRRITSCRPSILPDGMAWASFRDAGLLVAALLKNAGSLNDNRSIDMAVQRFTKLLLARGELGVLLAAINLTADARSGRMSLSRVAALVQVYELIGQLVRNAERAMKEASASAAPKSAELTRTERGMAFSGAVETNEAETALRQYLAFNPNAQADSGASAFFSEELAETSSRIAVDSTQRSILEWLGSGRHRLVSDVDLGKPVGIVIDRTSNECFTASHIRIVLVRDASVLGWHILRSSLVG